MLPILHASVCRVGFLKIIGKVIMVVDGFDDRGEQQRRHSQALEVPEFGGETVEIPDTVLVAVIKTPFKNMVHYLAVQAVTRRGPMPHMGMTRIHGCQQCQQEDKGHQSVFQEINLRLKETFRLKNYSNSGFSSEFASSPAPR